MLVNNIQKQGKTLILTIWGLSKTIQVCLIVSVVLRILSLISAAKTGPELETSPQSGNDQWPRQTVRERKPPEYLSKYVAHLDDD